MGKKWTETVLQSFEGIYDKVEYTVEYIADYPEVFEAFVKSKTAMYEFIAALEQQKELHG